MHVLNEAYLIWNRTGLTDPPLRTRAGDRALTDMLRVHGSVMNSGIVQAVECLNDLEFADTQAGYRYFGFDDVASLLSATRAMLAAGDDPRPHERRLDHEYVALIRSDQTLFERFEKSWKSNPSEYEPLRPQDMMEEQIMVEAQETTVGSPALRAGRPGSENRGTNRSARPWHLWLVGIIGGLWSVMGVVSFMLTQLNVEAVMSRFPPQQRAYFETLPWWADACWAVGVFGGVIGCALLLLKKRLAFGVLLASLIGTIVCNLGGLLLLGGMKVMRETDGLGLTLFPIFAAAFLAYYAGAMSRKGVLR